MIMDNDFRRTMDPGEARDADESTYPSTQEAQDSGAECAICHRPLSDPKSVAIGIGPICRGRIARGEVSKSEVQLGDYILTEPEIRDRIVMRREEGQPYTNVPRMYVHHSPDGFEWGYGGSGPADLALNICEIAVAHMNILPADAMYRVGLWDDSTCSGEAWALHQDFKWKFIAPVPEEGIEIPWDMAYEWCVEALEDLRQKGEV